MSAPPNDPVETELSSVLPQRRNARCSVKDEGVQCTRAVTARGLCMLHYKRLWSDDKLPPKQPAALRMTTVRISLPRAAMAEVIDEAKRRSLSRTVFLRKMVLAMLKRMKAGPQTSEAGPQG